MLLSTIRSVSRTNYFKCLQFIRLLSVPSLAHFTPYFSDSGSEDLNSNSNNDVIATDFENKLSFELNSSGVVQVLQSMEMKPVPAFLFFQQLQEKGFRHDTGSYLAMIKVLCDWGMNRELFSLFTEVINSKGKNLCFELSELLEAMTKELKANGPSSLLRAFDALIKSYATLGMFDEAIGILFATSRHGFGQCLLSCNFLMNKLVERGKFDITIAIYEQLKNAGLNPNVYTYGIVVKAYCRKGSFREAVELLWEMEEEYGVVPDKDSYCALIRVYCGSGDIRKALAIHDEMEAKGIRTNHFILTQILQCLCLKGMHFLAMKIFTNYKKKGIILDKIIYNVAIDALCKMSKLDEAENLFDEMKLKNLAPDIVHYTTLINGHCLNGNISDALHLFEEIDKKGLISDSIIYNVLVGGLSRNGLWDDVSPFLDAMKRKGLTPSTATHSMIIEGLCIGGRVKEAEKYFYNLQEKSIENCSSIVNGYCQSGKATEGFKLFNIFFSQGKLISRNSCAKLISCLCLEGENNRAIKVLKTMISVCDGPCKKKTYKDLIVALCRAGDMENAKWVFNQMIMAGITPSVVICTIMLNGYCQANRFQEAIALYIDMEVKGIIPDIITYTVLVDGCFKVNLTQKGLEGKKMAQQVVSALLCEMKKMELKPDVIFYTVLMDSQCKLEELEDAVSFFDDLIAGGLLPDTVTYTSLISGCCKQGNMEKASTLVKEMLSELIKPDTRTKATLHQLGKLIPIRLKAKTS